MPDIAIVIPTYNRGQVVAAAVKSALDGAGPGVELVVVDDASDDETEAVFAGFDDSRVRYLRLPARANGNVARNAGIAATTAPIVAFLDSDDLFKPGRAGRLVAYFAAHPEIDAVCDSFDVVNRGAVEPANAPARVLTGAALVDAMVCHAVPLSCSSIAVRRTVLEAIGGFAPALRRQQDRDLLLRLAPYRVAFGTGADVVKIQSIDSLSRQVSDYASGLDALVARHDVFRQEAYRDVLSYLSSRMILKAVFGGRLRAAWSEYRALARAAHLPRGLVQSSLRYGRGKRTRKALCRALAGQT